MASKNMRLYVVLTGLFFIWGGIAVLFGIGTGSNPLVGVILFVIGLASVIELGKELSYRLSSKEKEIFSIAFAVLAIGFLVGGTVVFLDGIGIGSNPGIGALLFSVGVAFGLAQQKLEAIAISEPQGFLSRVKDFVDNEPKGNLENSQLTYEERGLSETVIGIIILCAFLLGGGIAFLLGIGVAQNYWIGGVLFFMGLMTVTGLGEEVRNKANNDMQSKFEGTYAILALLFFIGGAAALCGIGTEANLGIAGILFAIGMSFALGLGRLQGIEWKTSNEPKDNFESPWSELGGKVYLLKAGTFYKIGVTQGSIENRVRALQTGSPYPIEIIHVVKTQNPYALEAKLHKDYANKRRQGEWFELDQRDVLKIKNIKKSK